MEATTATKAGGHANEGSAATASESAVGFLADATRERHRHLEAMPSQERLLADDYRLDEYRWLLQRLYGFYRPLAAALEHDAEWGARLSVRTSLLRRDLCDLGLTPADVRALARCRELPLLDSRDRVLGCAYVMEGATLGGRVIVKRLAQTFEDRAPAPMRFFSGDGERTGVRWRRACAIVNAEAGDFVELGAAACATFDAMAAWLGPTPVPESMPA